MESLGIRGFDIKPVLQRGMAEKVLEHRTLNNEPANAYKGFSTRIPRMI